MLKKKFVKDKCVTCKQCMIECAVRHSRSMNLVDAFAETPKPRNRLQVSIRKDKPHMTVCQNCAKPKCMAVCEYGAITKYEDGNVIIDTKKCRVLGMCNRMSFRRYYEGYRTQFCLQL